MGTMSVGKKVSAVGPRYVVSLVKLQPVSVRSTSQRESSPCCIAQMPTRNVSYR